jgi:hypothetical protein
MTNALGEILGGCVFLVTVLDKETPVISSESASPAILWPPDHRMVDVFVRYNAIDNCMVQITRLAVTSNEAVNGTGDGKTIADWEIVDAHHLKLRAERSARGNGRVYTVTITARDSSGNSSDKTLTVRVPKRYLGRR